MTRRIFSIPNEISQSCHSHSFTHNPWTIFCHDCVQVSGIKAIADKSVLGSELFGDVGSVTTSDILCPNSLYSRSVLSLGYIDSRANQVCVQVDPESLTVVAIKE